MITDSEQNIVLEAKGITKRFPGVLANDRVDFTLRKGEVHALLGENGAGKTTLMNVLYGLYDVDSGEFFRNGKPFLVHSPKDAIAQGIGMVHQHFMLIPVFTVTENIMLGDEDNGNPLRSKLTYDAEKIFNLLRGEHSRRLIQNQDLCIPVECFNNFHSLL